jgi:hypothetical protein
MHRPVLDRGGAAAGGRRRDGGLKRPRGGVERLLVLDGLVRGGGRTAGVGQATGEGGSATVPERNDAAAPEQSGHATATGETTGEAGGDAALAAAIAKAEAALARGDEAGCMDAVEQAKGL